MLEPEFAEQQRVVQRLLGRCLLRLQQYEKLMKQMVVHHALTGPVSELEAIQAKNVERQARSTLGMLVDISF